MGKVTKVTMKYRNGAIPDHFGALLNDADPADLRVLAAMLMLADAENGEVSLTQLPVLVGLDQAEVAASVKFWRGAGLLVNAAKESPSAKAKAPAEKMVGEQKAFEKTTVRAHRNGAVLHSGNTEAYTSAELADLMEKRLVSAQFVDEAQRILGKVFRTYDTGILVGLVDHFGFEEPAVLAMLAYMQKKGKKTLRYAEQMAIAFYDEGITETAAVMERINRMEQSAEVIGRVRVLFGAADREMSATEKKLFTAWTEKMAYDLEVIRIAYDMTVDKTGKAVPKYANTILESWHEAGLRTAEEVTGYLQTQQDKKNGDTTSKSYNIDDFFEAALQRSFEDQR